MSHQNYKLAYKKFVSIDIILYNINFLNINEKLNLSIKEKNDKQLYKNINYIKKIII